MLKTCSPFLLFSFFTDSVGEWQFSVFLRRDLGNSLGSLDFNVLYLTGVCPLMRPMLGLLCKRQLFILLYYSPLWLRRPDGRIVPDWQLALGQLPSQLDGDVRLLGLHGACPAHLLAPAARCADIYRLLRTGLYGADFALQVLISSMDWRFAFHIYAFILGYLGLMMGILCRTLRCA